MRKKINKKGQNLNGIFSQLTPIAIIIGVSIVVFVVMANVVQSLQDNEDKQIQNPGPGCNSTDTSSCPRNAIFNMSTQGLNLFTNIGAQFGLLGTITILGIIVAVLIALFGGFVGGGGGVKFQ